MPLPAYLVPDRGATPARRLARSRRRSGHGEMSSVAPTAAPSARQAGSLRRPSLSRWLCRGRRPLFRSRTLQAGPKVAAFGSPQESDARQSRLPRHLWSGSRYVTPHRNRRRERGRTLRRPPARRNGALSARPRRKTSGARGSLAEHYGRRRCAFGRITVSGRGGSIGVAFRRDRDRGARGIELSWPDLVTISASEDTTLADRLRDWFAFVVRGRYFWVRPVEDPCGPAFASLDEAMEHAHEDMALERVHETHGPLEVIEVRRRDRMRRVLCSDPTLMDAPIKKAPEPGVDFFPPEWAAAGKAVDSFGRRDVGKPDSS
jgi:hypothetical protein